MIPILLYHSVSDRPSDFIAPFTVTPAAFARHMDAVAASGATALTVSDLAAAARGERDLPGRPVLVTFDDGFADTLEAAAPVLVDRGIASTLYVTTGVVGGTSPGGDRMLDWSQIQELQAMGVEIGAHSHTHRELDTLPPAEAAREVRLCKEVLEEKTGRAVRSFAYPFGYSSPRVRAAVRRVGYETACSVKNALSSPADPEHALSRLMLTSATTDEQVDAWLNGAGAPVGQHDERLLTRGWRAWRRIRRRWGAPQPWAPLP